MYELLILGLCRRARWTVAKEMSILQASRNKSDRAQHGPIPPFKQIEQPEALK